MQRSQSTVVATFASGSMKMADVKENHGKFRCDISFDSFNFDQLCLVKSYQLTIIFV